MDKEFFEEEVTAALEYLRKGGIILYPTDTVWGIGCDATNAEAVSKIYAIKNRSDQKSMIVLVASERDIYKYVAAPDITLFDFLKEQKKPTTTVFEGALNLPDNLVNKDGTIAIRIVQDDFCRHLIKRLQKPIVSTSANISGEPTPATFSAIDERIKSAVDHVVTYRQDEDIIASPSQIIKWNKNGTPTYIRK